MSVEIRFPIEFIVGGTPVSAQNGGPRRRKSLREWQGRIRVAGGEALPEGHFASASAIAVTLYYFPAASMQGDIDNIVKPILDALNNLVYLNDHQFERVLVQKFEPDRVFAFASPSDALEAALTGPKPEPVRAPVGQSVRGPGLMSDASMSDADLLDPVVSRYKSEGFDVFIHPSPAVLPLFFDGCRPDAIAIDQQRKIAITIVRSGAEPSTRVSRLREIVRDQPEWELFVLYVSPAASTEKVHRASRGAVEAAMRQVTQLAKSGQQAAALVIGWSALEAVARILLPDRLARPQPAERLLEALASAGHLTPGEADALRPAATVGNAVAHGQLETAIEPMQLEALVSVLRTLIAAVPKDAA